MREGKQECLVTVRQLVELAFAARENGILKMDEMIQDSTQYPDRFLRKAVDLVVENSDPDKIRRVLYNLILSSKHVANHQFLKEVIITETMLAISQSEDLDYLFTYLIPSFFGLEYEHTVVEVYRTYKQQRFKAAKAGAPEEEERIHL